MGEQETLDTDEAKVGDTPDEGQVDSAPDSDSDVNAEEGKDNGTPDVVAVDPVLQALEAAGVEHTFTSGEEFVKSYGNLRSKLSTVDEDRRIGQELRPHLDKFRTWMAESQKREVEDQRKTVWDVPPLPPNAVAQLALPEDQRDPSVAEALRKRDLYLQEKWASYMENPGLMFQEHFQPRIQEMLSVALQSASREQELHEKLDPHIDFIKANISAIKEMTDQNMPLELAVELLQRRQAENGTKQKEESAKAKAGDEQRLAETKDTPDGIDEDAVAAGGDADDYTRIALDALNRVKRSVN